jgi:hypothetical protein
LHFPRSQMLIKVREPFENASTTSGGLLSAEYWLSTCIPPPTNIIMKMFYQAVTAIVNKIPFKFIWIPNLSIIKPVFLRNSMNRQTARCSFGNQVFSGLSNHKHFVFSARFFQRDLCGCGSREGIPRIRSAPTELRAAKQSQK